MMRSTRMQVQSHRIANSITHSLHNCSNYQPIISNSQDSETKATRLVRIAGPQTHKTR
jgi:hypothetical protein